MCTLTVQLSVSRYARRQGFGEDWIKSSSVHTRSFEEILTIGRYGQRFFRVYVPHLVCLSAVTEWLSCQSAAKFRELVGFARLLA